MSEYEIYGLTEKGSSEAKNEDHILLGRFVKNRGSLELKLSCDDELIEQYGLLLAVADGIGGASGGGAAASQQGLHILEQRYYASPKAQVAQMGIVDAAQQANQALLEIHTRRADWSHMGCSLAGIALLANGFYVFHSGDSRVYRYRHGLLKSLTRDDSLSQLELARGELTLAQVQQDESHRLSNYLGMPYFNCKIEFFPQILDDDILLIASDGFYTHMGNDNIETCLAEFTGSMSDLGKFLREEMLTSNAQDDYSFILLSKALDHV